ncbi:tetratricopeptide repeat protein [Actinoplanes sp. HUAS TT8]|uniref:tetratricopeptide repeat protein n=1 Tax=Actinoplanes sp. HUAS TT8 TaxID=3447453 RepID=UPI003F51E426
MTDVPPGPESVAATAPSSEPVAQAAPESFVPPAAGSSEPPAAGSSEPPVAPGSEVLAWPAPSGAPAMPAADPVAAAPVLPVPYGPQVGGPGEAHWLAQGEPPLVAAAHAAVDELRYTDAVRLLEEFLRANPADVRGWHRLAGARIGLNQYEAALADAGRSLDLDPDCVPAIRMRALALYFLLRWSEMEQLALRATQLAPEDADAHALLAAAYSNQGRHEEAHAAARAALAIDPGQQAAIRILAGNTTSIARWLPLVSAGAFPAGVVLAVMTLMLLGSPEAAIFGGFAVAAFLPLFTAVLRWALRSGGPGAGPALPRRDFLKVPILATAFVAIPVLITGTQWPGAGAVLLLTAAFATSCTLGLYRRLQTPR